MRVVACGFAAILIHPAVPGQIPHRGGVKIAAARTRSYAVRTPTTALAGVRTAYVARAISGDLDTTPGRP